MRMKLNSFLLRALVPGIGAALWLLVPLNGLAQVPQEIRWFRVGSLRSWYSSYGCEIELGRTGLVTEQNDGLMWPAEWEWQNNEVSKAMWIGTTNYFDRTLDSTVACKVVAVGTRTTDPVHEVLPISFRMYGRSNPPAVIVDGSDATDGYVPDQVDEVRDILGADRMIVNEFNTYIGITVRRTLLAFSQQYNDNYFIYDYVLKNTGIVDTAGTIENKPLTGVVFFFQYRYAFGDEAFRKGWYPSNNISWGRNAMDQVVGTNPNTPGFDLRAQYSWYGKHSQSIVPDDIGLPISQTDGHLAAVHFVGTVTLHADKSATDHSDDPFEPTTTKYLGNDSGPQKNDQFDLALMALKYAAMTAGHAVPTQADAVGTGFADRFGSDAGGYAQGKGYGPYTLAPGDSIHIVLAEGVAGLCRDSAFSIGKEWLEGIHGLRTSFTLPNGSTTSDPYEFKDAWVMTGIDSLLQTFRRARTNYSGGYQIPHPPPAPDTFQVLSGSDRIRLTWSSVSWPTLAGYDVYRSIMRPDTFYTRISSCGASVTTFDDTSARRGFDYYYYVVSKDDGTQNDISPGVPLVSSKFLTMTNVPAFLRAASVQAGAGTLPARFELHQNFPNPFNPVTNIQFTIVNRQLTIVTVFDVLGRDVATLVDEVKQPGTYSVVFDGSDLASGVYFYRIQAGSFVQTKKLLLLR